MSVNKSLIRLIVGMSRGGTTSMMRALNLRGDVAAYGESGFWGVQLCKSDAKVERSELQKISQMYKNTQFHPTGDEAGSLPISQAEISAIIAHSVEQLPDQSSAAEVFTAMGDGLAHACKREIWVEKTPHHLMHLERVISAQNDARIVVIIRNPSEFLLSYKHQGDRKPDDVKKNFKRLYHPILASLVCRGYLQQTIKMLDRYPENVILIKLEDIKGNAEEALNIVYDHLMLPKMKQPVFPKSNSSFGFSKKAQLLTNVEIFWLKIFVGKYARKLSYGLEDRPNDILGIINSLLLLGLWPFKNAGFLMKVRGKLGAMVRRWLSL